MIMIKSSSSLKLMVQFFVGLVVMLNFMIVFVMRSINIELMNLCYRLL